MTIQKLLSNLLELGYIEAIRGNQRFQVTYKGTWESEISNNELYEEILKED